jgi:acyl-CoA synthetase (AMP-forming)/AMP-acid ligase II
VKIEELLDTHPAIADVSVLVLPDRRLGEADVRAYCDRKIVTFQSAAVYSLCEPQERGLAAVAAKQMA